MPCEYSAKFEPKNITTGTALRIECSNHSPAELRMNINLSTPSISFIAVRTLFVAK